MPSFNIKLNQGEVTSRPKQKLEDGELLISVGAEYRKGDKDRIWKVLGRTLFDDPVTPSNSMRGVQICKFDPPNKDILLALSEDTLYFSDLGVTGELLPLQSNKTPAQTSLSAAHNRDRWYVVTGLDANIVISPGDPPKFRAMGMRANPSPPVLTFVNDVSAVTAVGPDAFVNGTVPFIEPGRALGSLFKDFSYSPQPSIGLDFPQITYDFFGASSSTTATRTIEITYWVFTSVAPTKNGSFDIKLSQNSGVSFSPLFSRSFGPSFNQMLTRQTVTFIIPQPTNNNELALEFSMFEASPGTEARIYSMIIRDGSDNPTFSLDAGKRHVYSVVEALIDDENTLESPASPPGETATDQIGGNTMLIALPPAANPSATHWKVYRTSPANEEAIRGEDATLVDQMGLIATLPITDTTYIDLFLNFGPDEQPTEPIPLLSIVVDGVSTFFPLNTPPPEMSHINAYKGALVGVEGRSLHRSLASRPESWPRFLSIQDFPLPSHDNLVATLQVGDTLLIGASEIMLAIDDNLRIVNGVPLIPDLRVVASVGLVSNKAMTNVTMGGQDRSDVGAWVSHEGIHLTNGFTSRSITEDADWEKKVDRSSLSDAVLDFDQSRNVLIFCYTDPAGNRRYALIHMDPIHLKSNGFPKATWGHYGDIADLAVGLFEGERRVYSAHMDRDEVYVENNGVSDESNAFDSEGNVPSTWAVFKSGNWHMVNYMRANILSTDSNSVLNFIAEFSQDSSRFTQRRGGSTNLGGNHGTNILLNRAGQYLELTLQHLKKADFGVTEIKVMAQGMDEDSHYVGSRIAK